MILQKPIEGGRISVTIVLQTLRTSLLYKWKTFFFPKIKNMYTAISPIRFFVLITFTILISVDKAYLSKL